ncbi:MAG: cupin domain-containing protein [Chloroflexi bacterium]|nr:cupin domain-containing protein [Chloroflexota bacterium]
MPYVARAEAIDDHRVDIHEPTPGPRDTRWRRPLIADPDLRVVLIGWPPGFVTVPHHHPHAVETFQVVSGHLGFRLDDRAEIELGPGGLTIARRGEIHGLRVLGDQPLVFIACVAPNLDIPDEQVDVPDRWRDWRPSDEATP